MTKFSEIKSPTLRLALMAARSHGECRQLAVKCRNRGNKKLARVFASSARAAFDTMIEFSKQLEARQCE